ncbi:hypothetical protein L2E82_01280 [Cichorium intybus]|uniref:Uncharacterized protein n=1 Tax=Cichorium intybus TaxID=13427 RepID=A0ACB9GYI3_CICIN|nr:hypothetical protein L2E82_01280 [Cichorium intybus]
MVDHVLAILISFLSLTKSYKKPVIYKQTNKKEIIQVFEEIKYISKARQTTSWVTERLLLPSRFPHYLLSSTFLHHIKKISLKESVSLSLSLLQVCTDMGAMTSTLFLMLLFICKTPRTHSSETKHMVPVDEYVSYRVVEGGRRKLSPFQVCLMCRCCVMAADPTSCTNMPCCFGIDCQLPNKPFGVCAFVPKTCNCTTCASP